MKHSLAQIARVMMTSRKELRSRPHSGDGPNTYAFFDDRIRCFINLAFTEGHSVESIMAYIDRSETMVTHVLRMECLDMYGGEYGRTLAQIHHQMVGLKAC